LANSSSSSGVEHPNTYQARKILKEIFRDYCYAIQEEVPLDEVTNNMEEKVWPPYRADMLLSKVFIIELVSKKLHGTKKRRMHDQWRDKNVKAQLDIPTVRLLSKDVLEYRKRGEDIEILKEIHYQLREQYDANK